jgi:hypothetical protein
MSDTQNTNNVVIPIPLNYEEMQNRISLKKINKTICFAIFFVVGINVLIYKNFRENLGDIYIFIMFVVIDCMLVYGSVFIVITAKKRLDLFLSQNVIFSISVFLKLLMFAIEIDMIKNWHIWLLCGMDIIFWVGFIFLFLKNCSQLYLRDDED